MSKYFILFFKKQNNFYSLTSHKKDQKNIIGIYTLFLCFVFSCSVSLKFPFYVNREIVPKFSVEEKR